MPDQNELEHALERAASDPSSRPDFYRILLESEVLVLGHSDTPGEGRAELPAGAKLSIVHWEKKDGMPVIPFFTSLTALRQSLKEEARFLGMPARSLFEMVKGETLVLNPASSYGKEFFPQEIESLLAVGLNHAPVQRIVEKQTQVLLGQPSNYPAQMVASIKTLLARHPNVDAAYLCLMQEPAAQTPSLVVGFSGTGDISRAMAEAGSVAADTALPGTPVDFVKVVRGEDGMSDYFIRSVKPFYRRTMGTALKGFFSGRKA
jgi:hypothetical protein